jgi:hypothetical protein
MCNSFPLSKVFAMIVDSPELARLETLPPDILHKVVDLLPLQQVKGLSRVEACLPTLFRRVKFEFSAGLGELRGTLESDGHCHTPLLTLYPTYSSLVNPLSAFELY